MVGRISFWAAATLFLFSFASGCCNQDFVVDAQLIGQSCSAYRRINGRWPQSVPEISEGASAARVAFDPTRYSRISFDPKPDGGSTVAFSRGGFFCGWNVELPLPPNSLPDTLQSSTLPAH